MKKINEAYLKAIPKTDLHLHLDGSLRIPSLIEMAQSGNIELPSYTESGLRELVFKDFYTDLPDYLNGFQYTVSVMQNAENLERIAYELGVDNLNEGVRYIEVRFAPQLHMHDNLNMKEVLAAVTKGLNKAKSEFNQNEAVKSGEDLPFEFGIIVCALRWFNPHMSAYYNKLFSVMSYAKEKDIFSAASLELAKAAAALIKEEGFPVVGFDLAGAEAGNPADDHEAAFQYAHTHFIKKTVHAGEAYGPESIFQAITDCHANRIGHGTHLFAAERIASTQIEDKENYIHELVKYIADTRTCIEINLTSNLQTLPELKSIADHPLKLMIQNSLATSICTDNRLMSNTSVTKELTLAVNGLDLDLKQLQNIVIAGFKGSFHPGTYLEKRKYVRAAIDRIKLLENVLV